MRPTPQWLTPAAFVAGLDDTASAAFPAAPTWADLDSGVSFVLAETDTIGGKIEEGKVAHWQVRVKLGATLAD